MCKGMEQVINAFRARLPMIWVTSREEERVTAAVRAYGIDRQVPVLYWSPISGQTEDLIISKFSLPEARVDADKGKVKLSQVFQDFWTQFAPQTEAGRRGAILVLPDLYDLLVTTPAAVRLLREQAQLLRLSNNSVVIIDPRGMPAELTTLRGEIEQIDLPLADRELMRQVVDDTARRLALTAEASGKVCQYDGVALTDAVLGLTVEEAKAAMRMAAVKSQGESIDVRDVLLHKASVINQSAALEYYPAVDAGSFQGYDILNNYLLRMGKALTPAAREAGIEYPKGLFLASAPGCGKTMSAKAAAGLWQLPLVRLNAGALFGSLVGQSERNWREAQKIINAIAPCVLLIDEIDKALGGNGDLDGGTSRRVFGEILTWLQDRTAPVVVIATANAVHQLPPELMRKGRFDELFMLDLPSVAERTAIIEFHCGARNLDVARAAVESLARVTVGFSGAELEAVVISARREAFYNDCAIIDEKVLLNEAAQTRPLSLTRKAEIDALRDWGRHYARAASSIIERQAGGAEVSFN